MPAPATKHSKRDDLRFPGYDRILSLRTDFEDGTARIVNISTGGCAIDNVTVELAVNQKTLIALVLEDADKPVQIQALVIRSDNAGFALQFRHLLDYQKTLLIRFFARENRRQKNIAAKPS